MYLNQCNGRTYNQEYATQQDFDLDLREIKNFAEIKSKS